MRKKVVHWESVSERRLKRPEEGEQYETEPELIHTQSITPKPMHFHTLKQSLPAFFSSLEEQFLLFDEGLYEILFNA